MRYYGYTITEAGQNLIAKLLAGETMTVTKVIFGDGLIPAYTDPRTLTELIHPIAPGVHSRPAASEGIATMRVEFRSDLNGGLETGFDLREFGIYALDPDEVEVMFYYATLGDHPQWVSPYKPSENGDGEYAIDVRRFPITFRIGENRGITALYNTELWMTEEDVYNYYITVLQPITEELIRRLIREHNEDKTAHPDMRKILDSLSGRMRLLELQLNTNVKDNRFLVTFETLDDVTLTGAWNQSLARVEF